MNLKQLFCFHNWIPVGELEYKHYTVHAALSKKLTHSMCYVDTNPGVVFDVLKNPNDRNNMALRRTTDDFCPKCENLTLD